LAFVPLNLDGLVTLMSLAGSTLAESCASAALPVGKKRALPQALRENVDQLHPIQMGAAVAGARPSDPVNQAGI